jgi:predicted nucleic-acid-binding protein
MRFADANIVLRYLLEDDQALSLKAATLIEHQNIHVPFEVLAEIVYVMQGVYKISRQTLAEVLTQFILLPTVSTNSIPVAVEALRLYAEKGLDFVDSLLCSYARIDGVHVETFDKKLNTCCKRKQ